MTENRRGFFFLSTIRCPSLSLNSRARQDDAMQPVPRRCQKGAKTKTTAPKRGHGATTALASIPLWEIWILTLNKRHYYLCLTRGYMAWLWPMNLFKARSPKLSQPKPKRIHWWLPSSSPSPNTKKKYKIFLWPTIASTDSSPRQVRRILGVSLVAP